MGCKARASNCNFKSCSSEVRFGSAASIGPVVKSTGDHGSEDTGRATAQRTGSKIGSADRGLGVCFDARFRLDPGGVDMTDGDLEGSLIF
jgi:hypothetical protein